MAHHQRPAIINKGRLFIMESDAELVWFLLTPKLFLHIIRVWCPQLKIRRKC